MARSKWEKEYPNLGKVPDRVIAERLGVSRERVRQVRTERGIEAYVGPYKDWTDEEITLVSERLGERERIDHLSSVPLTFPQLKYLINRRVEMGWSQADLARQTGSTTVTIHKFEAGYPIRPGLFIDLCHYLGIEPVIEIVVELPELDTELDTPSE